MLKKLFIFVFLQYLFVCYIIAQNTKQDTSAKVQYELIDILNPLQNKTETGYWGIGLSSQLSGTSLLNIYDKILIVVNGIPFSQVSTKNFDFATADERDYANLIGVSLNDIIDVSIEDNPVSSSLYGVYAKGGIIYVSTINKNNQSFAVNYSYKNTIGKRAKYYKMLDGDQYSTLMQEAYLNTHNYPMNTNVYKEFLYLPTEPYYYYNYGANTDWYNEINKKSTTKDHYLSLSGRGDKIGYRLSAGYIEDEGTLGDFESKKFNTRLGLNYKFKSFLKVNFDLDYMNTDLNDYFYADDEMDLYELSYKKMPHMSVYEYDVNGDQTGTYFNPANNIQGISYYNPVMMMDQSSTNTNSDRFTSTFSLKFNFNDKLSYLLQCSYQINKSDIQSSRLLSFSDNQEEDLKTELINDNKYNFFLHNILRYQFLKTDLHQLQGLISYNVSHQRFDNKNVNGSSVYEYENDQQNQILLGGIHYLLLKKYQFDLSLRSERYIAYKTHFNPTNDPAVSVKWILSEEGIFKKLDFINHLSLGGDYGVFTVNNYSVIEDYTEKFIQKDLNLNTILFKERLKVNFKYYTYSIKDYLSPYHYYPSISYAVSDQIKYVLVNTGWDFNLNMNLVQTNNFNLDFHLNLYKNKQKIIDLASDAEINNVANRNGEYQKQLINNMSYGAINGYVFNGVYQYSDFIELSTFNGYQFTGGDAIYADIHSDGVIDENDVTTIGNANPKFTGSGGPSIRYKNWWLGIYVDFRFGNDIVNMTRMNLENMYGYDNQTAATLDRWRHEGDVTNVPRSLLNYGYNWLGSTRFVEDGSYVRLKGVTLKYEFSKNLINKVKLEHLSLFVSARNVFTLTKYKGSDPAISLNTDWQNYGFDNNYISPLQEFTLGIDIGI
nr:hypothetical protein [uncultured Carboxylicivirga sp.]